MSSELAGARTRLEIAGGTLDRYSLPWLTETGVADVSRLPHTVAILLENLLRRAGTRDVADEDVRALARWPEPSADVAFMPGRVLMQDFTGVPAVVDLAAMRSAVARAGRDPSTVNPLVPVDLIIDHSVPGRSLPVSETPIRPTSSGSTGATVSATRSSAGRNRRSTASGWFPPAPASATRSTSSTSARS